MSYKDAVKRADGWVDSFSDYFIDAFKNFVTDVGEMTNFAIKATRLGFQKPFRKSELIQHMEFVGNKSLIIILLAGTFTGMAMAMQIYQGFKIVNMTSLVGPTVALGITREIGPVLTGLIVSARAGGAMAARLGTMRVTEQIDAIEVIGVDPIQYLIAPRIFAAVLVMPLLAGMFSLIAIVGCWFICVGLLEMDQAQFIEGIARWLEPKHINECLFKASVFGFFFGVICTYRGFFTKGGAEGVGISTNRGVVSSMVMVIILDFFVTNLINIYYDFVKLVFS